jgi:hypothetical protein
MGFFAQAILGAMSDLLGFTRLSAIAPDICQT